MLNFFILDISVNQNEAQDILDKAQQYLPVASRVVSALRGAIESQNEAQIKKEVEKIQEIASDNLVNVCKAFTDSLQNSSSRQKLKCLIL